MARQPSNGSNDASRSGAHSLLERYTDAALGADRPHAANLATEMLRDVGEPELVIRDLLAPSQVEVGKRWQEQLCSVGSEHAATFITESVLSSLSVGMEPPPDRGSIVMVCADGEWHGLPARLASELLMLQGWRVTFLGAATPTAHLRRYLADIDADAVGVSCTVASNLPGAARAARVARHLGFTVIAGGQGFGNTSLRAKAIGADGWVRTIDANFSLESIVWPRVAEPDEDGVWAHIIHDRVDLVRQAVGWIGEHHPSVMASPGSWMEHVINDLDEIVGFAAAAELCNDPSIVHGYRRWLESMLSASGLPNAVVNIGFDAISAVLEPMAPRAAAMLVHSGRRN
jgi:methanogenic corrinoid protein MtbC1